MIKKAYKVMNNIKTAAYLPPKEAIAVLRFPRVSHISIRGYAQKCLRTHHWPLGLVSMATTTIHNHNLSLPVQSWSGLYDHESTCTIMIRPVKS